ncbi:unnamed protein product [Macrosiphum euphorbiae]|uniref:Uncharacterized protein n=1 Tax=Macrosiphum euphorbiae TaxID=13131 RepID=A0AAV0W694_9HEMI|nr:unnamed protein product [Macrosiphum euphorbiae]
MVNKYEVKGCKTTAIKGSKVHVFPKDNICRLWVNAVQQYQLNFLPSQQSIIRISVEEIEVVMDDVLSENSGSCLFPSIKSEVSDEEIEVIMDNVLCFQKSSSVLSNESDAEIIVPLPKTFGQTTKVENKNGCI